MSSPQKWNLKLAQFIFHYKVGTRVVLFPAFSKTELKLGYQDTFSCDASDITGISPYCTRNTPPGGLEGGKATQVQASEGQELSEALAVPLTFRETQGHLSKRESNFLPLENTD